MLKIKNIKFGLIPTGPAIGVSALQIFFDEDDKEYTPDDYDLGIKKWEQNRDNRMISENPKELFSQLLDTISKLTLEDVFETVLNSKQSCFIVFMSGQIDNPKNFEEFNRFHIDLSNRTWNYQITTNTDINRLKPPYCVFCGVPQFMSGKNQFYEFFNCIYPILHLKEEEKCNYNSLALQETLNGPFTLLTIFYENGNPLEVGSIKEKFKTPNHKVCVIDVKSTKANDLTGFIKVNNFRYFPYLKGKDFLKLI